MTHMIKNGSFKVGLVILAAAMLATVTGCGQTQSTSTTATVPTADAQALLSALSTVQGKVNNTSGSVQTQSQLGTQSTSDGTTPDADGYRTTKFDVTTEQGPFRINIRERYYDANNQVLLDTNLFSLLEKSRRVEVSYEESTNSYSYVSSGTVLTHYVVDAGKFQVTSVDATAEGSATYTYTAGGVVMTISRIHAEAHGARGVINGTTEFDWSLPINDRTYHGTITISVDYKDFRAVVKVAGDILRSSQKVGSVRLNSSTNVLELVLDDGTVIALN